MEVLYGATIRSLQEDTGGVDVVLSGGETRRFDLVIGADGLRSRVRELEFASESTFEHFLGYYAASFVAANYPHRDEATYVSRGRPGRQISRYAMGRLRADKRDRDNPWRVSSQLPVNRWKAHLD